MNLYIKKSAEVVNVYLDFVSEEDIHVYSIDEAFFDVTPYMEYYQMSARDIGIMIIDDVYKAFLKE